MNKNLGANYNFKEQSVYCTVMLLTSAPYRFLSELHMFKDDPC